MQHLVLLVTCVSLAAIGCTQNTHEAENALIAITVDTKNAIEARLEAHSDSSPTREFSHRDGWSESETGGRKYGAEHSELNGRLVDTLMSHFRDFPIPDGYHFGVGETDRPEDRYRIYAYILWDWFDDNRQVRFLVSGDVVSHELLLSIQHLLVDEYSGWSIIAMSSRDNEWDFDAPSEIVVFSDRVFVPESFVNAYAQWKG